jgi:catechol 2,3-dioxygenase-like lactoylglutathione lyase family enzyme
MTGSDGVTPRFEAVTPRIPVQDVAEALKFYLDQLGFDLGWKWGTPVTHANVCRDSISLDLIRVPADRRGTAMAYIEVSGVDAYYSELTARGVGVSNLGDRDYGMRDFEVVDTNGNRLAFGEPTER